MLELHWRIFFGKDNPILNVDIGKKEIGKDRPRKIIGKPEDFIDEGLRNE